jgi:tRNA nucleotidyltransferase/poly(A) polymerase
VEDVKFIVQQHMRFKNFGNELNKVSNKVIRKIVNDLGERRDLVFQVVDADNKAHAKDFCLPNQIANLKERIANLDLTEKVKIELPIDGKDVMEIYHMKPSKEVGEMLEYVKSYYYENPNLTKEQCLEICNVLYKTLKNEGRI